MDRLDIAHDDENKWVPTFRLTLIAHKGVFKNVKSAFLNDNGHFSTLSGFWRKSSHGLGIFEGLKWKLRLSVESPRKPHVRENFYWFLMEFTVRGVDFLNDPFSFGSISCVWSVGWTSYCIDLILHVMIELNFFQHLATLLCHVGSFWSYKKAFLNDPKCQKEVFWTWSVVSTWCGILWWN